MLRPWERPGEEFSLKQIEKPTEEPVKLQEDSLEEGELPEEGAKNFLRVDYDVDNSLIESLITTARIVCENEMRRAMLTQTWELGLDVFPCRDYIRLPLPPLQSVEDFVYKDSNGDEQTFEDYEVDDSSTPGRVFLKPSAVWPSDLYSRSAIKITFVAGYETPEEMPEAWVHAIRMLIAHFYENREAVNIGSIVNELPFAVNALLSPYKVWWTP